LAAIAVFEVVQRRVCLGAAQDRHFASLHHHLTSPIIAITHHRHRHLTLKL
jgi:hypothetical protein